MDDFQSKVIDHLFASREGIELYCKAIVLGIKRQNETLEESIHRAAKIKNHVELVALHLGQTGFQCSS